MSFRQPIKKSIEIYRISFIGPKEIFVHDDIIKRMNDFVTEMLYTKEYVTFLVAHAGYFDKMAASTVKLVRKGHDLFNNTLIMAMPYPYTKDLSLYEAYYDKISIALGETDTSEAITKNNRWMIDNSDLLVTYVENGREDEAKEALTYAKQKGIEIINFATKK